MVAMAEIQVKDRLPGLVGRGLPHEIPGKLDIGRERVLTKDVSSLYKALMDQVEVRAWAVANPPTGKTVIENMGAYSNVVLTAHWKKNAPTILYGAGEAFVPSSYPVEIDSHKKAVLIKTDRKNIANLVRQAVANDAKAAALERIGRADFKGKAARLRLKADAAYAKAKLFEVGLKMDIQSLPYTERVSVKKAEMLYFALNLEIEGAWREGRELSSDDIDHTIQKLRRELGIVPPKSERYEAEADKTPKKRTIYVARGLPTTVIEAQASDMFVHQAPSRSHRAVNYLFLGSELGVLVGSAVACSPATPIEVSPPGANEVLISFNAEEQRTAAISVMSPWEGQTLKDGFSVSENGTFTFFREENLMLHQTNAAGEQMPGMVTLAWADAVNTSTNQAGKESFLFFMNDQGIPTQAVLLEFQPPTFEDQISAILTDADGKLVGYININTDPNKTDLPFASIQYTPATAVPGNPGVEKRNVVDLTFGPGSTKDNKEEFANAFVAFATGAGSAFAASGEVISVTPTAELATPTPALPEVIPIGAAELSAIVTEVNEELYTGYSLTANPEGAYVISNNDGQMIENILLNKDGRFYITQKDGSITVLPPEVVFMPNDLYLYAGFDRFSIGSREMSPIPIEEGLTDPEMNPRMTDEMLPQYEEWLKTQLIDSGILDQRFKGANTSMGWEILSEKSFDGSYSLQALFPKGTKTSKPIDKTRMPQITEVPIRSFLSFVHLVDHPGTSVLPVYIKNAPDSIEEYSLFPGVVETNQIVAQSKGVTDTYPLSSLFVTLIDTKRNKDMKFYIIVSYVVDTNSSRDGLMGTVTLSQFKDGIDPDAQAERFKILTNGIATGQFSNSSTVLWPLSAWIAYK